VVGLIKEFSVNHFYKSMFIFLVFCFNINSFGLDDCKSFKLDKKYLRIFPCSLSDDGVETKFFSVQKGTIEFWIKFNQPEKKGIIPVFFWGERGWKNSVLMQLGNKNIFYARVSSHNWLGQIQFSQKIALNHWYHIALQWDTPKDKISIEKTKLFINGKLVQRKSIFHNSKSPDPEFLGGKLSDSAPYYILIGAIKNNSGKLDKKLLPNIQIAQFRISGTPRYDEKFTPQRPLKNDKNTFLFISTEKEKPKAMFKETSIETEERKY
jgi:Concanavalin A-like lectin/glucanases superfamily